MLLDTKHPCVQSKHFILNNRLCISTRHHRRSCREGIENYPGN